MRNILVLIIIYFFVCINHSIARASKEKPWIKYIKNGSVLVAADDKIIYSYNINKQFIPASTLKLATSLAALHYLGKDYHFKTEFYLDSSKGLTIKGYGDPNLVSEEWVKIVKALIKTGDIQGHINNIYLDTGFFDNHLKIPGISNTLNPYDASNGALVTNYNSIYLNIKKNGKIESAEPQTPLIPLSFELGKKLSTGKHRINISQNPNYVATYTGQIFEYFLKQENIINKGSILQRRIRKNDNLIYSHKNKSSLINVIESMMLYSNNFIANQLLLTFGSKEFGQPANLEKGVKALRNFLEKELRFPTKSFNIVEGSGISRENRITPLGLLTLLKEFKKYKYHLPTEQGIFLKTGTLKGVSCLAGYINSYKKDLYLVVMLNQEHNHRSKILSLLLKEYGKNTKKG